MGELTAELERHDLIESASKRYALGRISISSCHFRECTTKPTFPAFVYVYLASMGRNFQRRCLFAL